MFKSIEPQYCQDDHSDSIEQLISHVTLGSELVFESGFCKSWNMLHGPTCLPDKAALHLVTAGVVWFAQPGNLHQQIQLKEGDALFFSHQFQHWLSDAPLKEHTQAVNIDDYVIPDHLERGLVCYDITIKSHLTAHLFQVLPDFLHIPAGLQSAQLSSLIQLISQEVKSRQPGYQSAISRLSELIVLHLLRQALSDDRINQGLLMALRDPALQRVTLAIMQTPEADWSVESMADQAYLSKSAFADRCHKILGMTAKSLLDQLRLQRCRYLLLHTQASVEMIAEQVGYHSASAFIRFFKQYESISPGEYRAKLA